jgi:hypothetical protein
MPVCQKNEEIVARWFSLVIWGIEKDKITYEHKLKGKFNSSNKHFYFSFATYQSLLLCQSE